MRRLAVLSIILASVSVRAQTFEAGVAALSARLKVPLDAAKPVPAPALPAGTPRPLIRLFDDGWRSAMSALKGRDCRRFFGDAVAETMRATEYRFLTLPQGPTVGAQTNGPRSVFINAEGLFVTASDGRITLDRRGYDLWSADRVRAMILLHELGHQLKLFGPDAGPELRAENARHSLDVIAACVPGRPLP